MNAELPVIPDDLVSAARTGDPDALATLWDMCAPILRFALRRQRSHLSTVPPSDLAQEAAVLFLELLRRPADRPDEPFGRRFARTLYWRLHDYLRAERRRLGRQVAATEPDLERALRQRAAGSASGPSGRLVARAIERLSPRQRAVIAGIYFEDRKETALAAELGVSPQAISALHRRALATLRGLLSEEGRDL